jgi:hypothetical protein
MSALAQLRHERIAALEHDLDYLRGQVDCLIGNPANIGNSAYQRGYADAYELQAKQTGRSEAAELPEGVF